MTFDDDVEIQEEVLIFQQDLSLNFLLHNQKFTSLIL